MKFGTIATMAAAVSLLGSPAIAQSMGGASGGQSPSAQGANGMTTGDMQAPQGRSMSRDGGAMRSGTAGGSMNRGAGGSMGGGKMGGQPGTANPRNGY